MLEKRAQISGQETSYGVAGEGKPFLILHGWGSKSDKWQRVVDLLADKGFLVLIPDLPGFGKSMAPRNVWSLDDYVDFVDKFARATNLSGFYLLGHSFGGAIALKYSLKFPGKVRKIFLVASALVRKKGFLKNGFKKLSKLGKKFSFIPFYSVLRKAFYRFIIRKSDYYLYEGIMRDSYLKIIEENLSDQLRRLVLPATIIWGDKDNITPLDQAHFINKEIKNSNLVVISGAGHDLEQTSSEILSEKILENVKL